VKAQGRLAETRLEESIMLREFKEFVMRGGVVELAVALVIGVAFGKIVASFVTDILMPPIGLLLGNVDFSNLFVSLSGQTYPTLAAAKTAGAATINYGVFLQTVVDFVIVAFAIFMIVRQLNRMKRSAAPAVLATQPCRFCLSPIALKASRCPHCTSELLQVAA
jgi:large conductance mechanosensitive channel